MKEMEKSWSELDHVWKEVGNQETEPWHCAQWKPWGEVEWPAVSKSPGPLKSKLSPPLPHTMASTGGLLSVSSQTLLLLGKKLRTIRTHPSLALTVTSPTCLINYCFEGDE